MRKASHKRLCIGAAFAAAALAVLVVFAMVPTTPLARWLDAQASALQVAAGELEEGGAEQGELAPQSTVGVSSFADLKDAITAAAGTSVEIDVTADISRQAGTGKITLPADTSVTLTSSGNHSITLNMAFMSLTNPGCSLTLGGGLTIASQGKQVARVENGNAVTINGAYVQGGSVEGTDPAFAVIGSGSSFTMLSGMLYECKSSSASGVVQVQNGAEATLSGGMIEWCEGKAAAPIRVADASLTISGCMLESNRGAQAGALYCTGSSGTSSVVMSSGRIKQNTSEGSGGGVYCEETTFSMTGGSIESNLAALYGGGIALFSGAEFTLDGGTFVDNQANSGGAIYVEGTDAVELRSGTIEKNQASGSYGTGGGVAVARYAKGSSSGGVTIREALVTGNRAATIGGGAWLSPSGQVDSRVSDGAVMYGNTADKAGDDMAVTGTAGAHGRDVVQGRMLGGGFFDRYIDGAVINGTNADTRGEGNGKRYRADNRREAFDYSTWNGLTPVAWRNVASEETLALAKQRARLSITENIASNAGGGIASTGRVQIGDTATKRVAVKKKWDVPDGISPLSSVEVKLWIDGAQDEAAHEIESATLNAANDWTCVFDNLPVRAKVNVEEAALSPPGWVTSYQQRNYNGQGIDSPHVDQPGTEQDSYSGLQVVTLSNARAGLLKISNTVTGEHADPDKEFSFKVSIVNPDEPYRDSDLSLQSTDSLANDPYEGRDASHHAVALDYPYTGSKSGSLVGGSGTINLKGGENVTLSGLPHGALFEVEEVASSAEGYQVKPTRDGSVEGHAAESGTIEGDDAVTLAYANLRVESAGSLEVSKQVTGNLADTQKSFSFRLRLFNSDGTEMTGTGFSYTGSSSGVIESGGEFSLKSGESIQVGSIPEGTRWTVKEVSADAHGYQIKPSRGMLTGEDAEQGTIESGGVSTLAYTNEKNESLGSLAVQKTVEQGDEDRAFQLVVRLFGSGGSELTGTEYAYTGSNTGVISSGASLSLKHGERVVIEGIPADATFRVTEVNADDYTITYDGCEGTIVADSTAEAKVLNKVIDTSGGGGSGDGSGDSGGGSGDGSGDSGGGSGDSGSGDAGNSGADGSNSAGEGGAGAGNASAHTSSASTAAPSGNDSGAASATRQSDPDNTSGNASSNVQNGGASGAPAPKGPVSAKTGDALTAAAEGVAACALIATLVAATVFTRRLRKKLGGQ